MIKMIRLWYFLSVTDLCFSVCVHTDVSPSSLLSFRVISKRTTQPRPGSTAWQTAAPCSLVSSQQHWCFIRVHFQTTQTFCVCVCACAAPFGSLIGNRWSCRVSVILGGLLSSCGLLLSSFSNSLEFLYFSMGIMMGQRESLWCHFKH